MTYLELVNEVLTRLRESEVTTISQNRYSALIAKFVNDAKRQREDAWNWEAFDTTLPITTAAATSRYLVTGIGLRHKHAEVYDTTNQTVLNNVPLSWIERQQQISTVQNGNPVYFAWDGNNGTDSYVQLFPTPNGAFTVNFNVTVPQLPLSVDADVLTIPSEPVILGAYARALVERGEDGALNSSEAYNLFKSSMADAIALEATRSVDNDCWIAN